MTTHDAGYVNGLATELRCKHASLLANAEDDLAEARWRMQTIARFIHNEAIPFDVRFNLARDLHLPEPSR